MNTQYVHECGIHFIAQLGEHLFYSIQFQIEFNFFNDKLERHGTSSKQRRQ